MPPINTWAVPQRTPSGPTPRRMTDLQAFENISRLEQSAEEISQGGSDIGEEIRKMNEAEKERSRSRQNSIQSSHHGENVNGGVRPVPIRMSSGGARSRTSSYGNSIVDVNGNARWGGYSPGGYISSPVGSAQSGSWVHATVRTESTSKSSRLAQSQMVEPMQEGRPLDSPLGPSNASLHSQEQQTSRRASQSSFARRYDQIAEQMTGDMDTFPMSHLGQNDHQQHPHISHDAVPERPRSTDTFQEAQIAFKDFDGVHFSPETEEFIEVDENGQEIRRVSARSSSGSLLDIASRMRTSQRPMSYAAPPPNENMVYYPAPVPRMLNLPKRLSQLPAANVQARRRTQMLSGLPAGARQSAPWLSQTNFSDTSLSQRSGSGSASQPDPPRSMLNQRMSVANLPAQLRATMYFEHQSVPQDVDVKSESAVATLDSILAASATAPVNAFTDHPYAGDVRKSVYAPDLSHRRSTATLASHLDMEKKSGRRKSSIGNLFRRASGNLDGELERPSSRGSGSILDSGSRLQKRKSVLSLGDGFERVQEDSARTPASELREFDFSDTGLVAQAANANHEPDAEHRPATALSNSHSKMLREGDQIAADFKEEQEKEDFDDADVIFAQPSTLLAELQVRKAQQKSRSKTAANAFPNGMHSTLLQLDAVEEIHKKNRKGRRIDLAWEDPALRAQDAAKDEDDDEVPLGMLYPARDGLLNRKVGDGRDWNRPLGLMERRELEDNEPLSSRRNRLRGVSPPRAIRRPQPPSTMPSFGPVEAPLQDEETIEDTAETLQQRLRRLKTKDALDTAISDVAPKSGERPLSTFTDEVLSQFGGLNVPEKDEKDSSSPVAAEGKALASGEAVEGEQEETLGQRRARLQREREASGELPSPTTGDQARPQLRQSQSLANLLAANPVGNRAISSRHQEPAFGTLLHASAQMQNKQKQDLFNKNIRATSTMLEKPLVDSGRPQMGRKASSGLLAQQGNSGRPNNGGFAGGVYNHSGQALPTSVSNTPGFGMGMGNASGYFVSPTLPFVSGHGSMMGYPQQSPSMNPLAYAAAPTIGPMTAGSQYSMLGGHGYGAQQHMAYGAPMGMMGMAPVDMPLKPDQRSAIDQWRMGIAP